MIDESVAAVFQLDGQEAQVATVELGLELARRERLLQRGQNGIEHLVLKTLIEIEIEREGINVSTEESKQALRDLRSQLTNHGHTLEAVLKQRNLTLEQFEQVHLPLSIAQDKLILKTAELSSKTEITAELRELWEAEARANLGVTTEPEQLGPGVVARVGDRFVTMDELGGVLLQSTDRDGRVRGVQQIVIRRLLDAAAKQHEITVEPTDIEADIARRKAEIDARPELRQVGFAQLLKSQGTSIEALRRSPVTRAQVQREKLGKVLFSTSVLEQLLATDGEAIRRKHGPRRHVHMIWVRGTKEPTELIPLDIDAAMEKAAEARKRITQDGERFGVVARIVSDEPNSKVRGGDLGLVSYTAKQLPREVLDVAFSLPPFVISAPIRAKNGAYLAMVTDVEEPPPHETLLARMRGELLQKHVLELLKNAEIRVK